MSWLIKKIIFPPEQSLKGGISNTLSVKFLLSFLHHNGVSPSSCTWCGGIPSFECCRFSIRAIWGLCLPLSCSLGSLGTSLREGEHKGAIESARSEVADKAAFRRRNGLLLSVHGVLWMNLHKKLIPPSRHTHGTDGRLPHLDRLTAERHLYVLTYWRNLFCIAFDFDFNIPVQTEWDEWLKETLGKFILERRNDKARGTIFLRTVHHA